MGDKAPGRCGLIAIGIAPMSDAENFSALEPRMSDGVELGLGRFGLQPKHFSIHFLLSF